MNLERASLLAMSLGLLCVIQPWAHALFVIGFPLTLAGVIVYDVAARRGGDGEERT
jgi:hypothetical protein